MYSMDEVVIIGNNIGFSDLTVHIIRQYNKVKSIRGVSRSMSTDFMGRNRELYVISRSCVLDILTAYSIQRSEFYNFTQKNIAAMLEKARLRQSGKLSKEEALLARFYNLHRNKVKELLRGQGREALANAE